MYKNSYSSYTLINLGEPSMYRKLNTLQIEESRNKGLILQTLTDMIGLNVG
jgi:hypothetical protein